MKKNFAQILLFVWLISSVIVAEFHPMSVQAASPMPPTFSHNGATVENFIPLRLRGETFDPKHNTASTSSYKQRTLNDESYGLRLIQFAGPIQQEWYTDIQHSELKIVSYLPDYAYLVWGNGYAIDKLQTQAPLRWAGTYQPHYALHPALRESKTQTAYVEVTIQVYDHPGADQSITKILDQAVKILRQPSAVLVYRNLSVRIATHKLSWLSQLPDVVNIEPLPDYRKLDEIQGQIMANHLTIDGTQPSGPGYLTWLTTTLGFPTNPDAYPIVDITDDGIDDGDDTPNHPDFYKFGDSNQADRLIYNHNWTTDASADGAGGHGNLNAAIVAGYNDQSGSAYEDGQGYNYGLGINPFGRIAGSKIFENAGPYYAPSYATIINTSYEKGARISSNSWGEEPGSGAYLSDDQAYDALVRDAQATVSGNQEMLIVFAAGNSGISSNTIGSPANAKNVITVGAAESYRPTWTDGCGVPPSGADNAHDIINFSSRGPTDDGRVKPDLVAPGTHIQGAATMASSYTGLFVCDAYHPNGQTLYAASSGTSHATPAVAGAASLFYRYYQDTFSDHPPSPAMTKAYLVNTARYLNGVGSGGTLPSHNQGFGEVNLGMAFNTTQRMLADQDEILENSGDAYVLEGSISNPDEPFRVTLAWTDAPGSTIADAYVNNLDLEVTLNGQLYLGNVFSAATSTTGGSADPRNNVESVFIPPGQSGTFSIKVKATNIAGDGVPNNSDVTDQDFALVCYNCTQRSDFTLSVWPTTQQVCPPNPAHYVVTPTSIMGFQSPITLSLSPPPPSSTLTLLPNPVLPGQNAYVVISPSIKTPAGHYAMHIVGIADSKVHTQTLELEIFDYADTPPTLLSPTHAMSNVNVLPTLAWDAVPDATSYKIEIAKDTTFITPTYTAITSYITHALTQALEYKTMYYWRVTSRNHCGSGGTSSPFNFTTQEISPTHTQATLSITPTTLTLVEGAFSTYTIAVTPSLTAPLTLSLTTDAQVEVQPQAFTFQADTVNLPQTIKVTAINDAAPEGPHTSIISHTISSTAQTFTSMFVPTVTVQITDNDVPTPTLQPTLSFITESYTTQKHAGSTPITVTLGTIAPTTVTADYATYDQTAIAGTDYVSQTGTLTFSPGDTLQTLTLTILDNPHNIVSKSVSLALSNPYSATLIAPQTATLYILGYATLNQHLYLPLVLKLVCDETICLP